MIQREGSLDWIEIPDFVGMCDFLDLAGLALANQSLDQMVQATVFDCMFLPRRAQIRTCLFVCKKKYGYFAQKYDNLATRVDVSTPHWYSIEQLNSCTWQDDELGSLPPHEGSFRKTKSYADESKRLVVHALNKANKHWTCG